ncbi:MAG: nucleotide exchange factor GrpE [Planctomycetes bacterium]|nr:nucleotide exchange factor GrpE [Planctomycetota bacterium]
MEGSRGQRSPQERDALRERWLARFAVWLDGVLADEPPPAGIAPEILEELERDPDVGRAAEPDARCDRYGMWAGLISLVQEVKLEGRAFKDLAEKVAPLGDLGTRVDAALRAHVEALAEMRRFAEEGSREAERRARKDLLGALIDVRDRLKRGLEVARDHISSRDEREAAGGARWWERFFPRRAEPSRDVIEAFERGYEMALERAEEALAGLGIREIECIGRPFDPRRMAAAEVEETDRVAEGTVLGIHRAGYLWDGETLRPAQVKVARAPGAAEAAPGTEGEGWTKRI